MIHQQQQQKFQIRFFYEFELMFSNRLLPAIIIIMGCVQNDDGNVFIHISIYVYRISVGGFAVVQKKFA